VVACFFCLSFALIPLRFFFFQGLSPNSSVFPRGFSLLMSYLNSLDKFPPELFFFLFPPPSPGMPEVFSPPPQAHFPSLPCPFLRLRFAFPRLFGQVSCCLIYPFFPRFFTTGHLRWSFLALGGFPFKIPPPKPFFFWLVSPQTKDFSPHGQTRGPPSPSHPVLREVVMTTIALNFPPP